MVSKLGLALLEAEQEARRSGLGDATVSRLSACQRDVRAGLGYAKTAYKFGAFPNEAYSHTPAHAGAQQPGMTGQVKEDVVARLTELGVSVEDGLVGLDPGIVADGEWLRTPATLTSLAPDGSWADLEVPPGHLAFTLCGVPVTYRRGGDCIEVTLDDGTRTAFTGTLDTALSRELLARTGRVSSIRVI